MMIFDQLIKRLLYGFIASSQFGDFALGVFFEALQVRVLLERCCKARGNGRVGFTLEETLTVAGHQVPHRLRLKAVEINDDQHPGAEVLFIELANNKRIVPCLLALAVAQEYAAFLAALPAR